MEQSTDDLIERYRISPEELLEANNQIIPEVAGTGDACNPFKTTTSSPRNHMTDKFLSQQLYVEGAEPRRFYTGIERQMGESQYNVCTSMPSDGTIRRIIPMYTRKLGEESINGNPETLVIYEEFENENGIPGTLRAVVIKDYHTEHKLFGFKFKLNKFKVGDFLPKGYPLSIIPSISPEGQYCYGVEAKTVFMSIPGITEDGVIISKSFSEKLKTTVIGTVVVSYGDTQFPLNVNGTPDKYKPFLDIGDTISKSGLICALRDYNPLFNHITLSKNTVCGVENVDFNTDRTFFGIPGAKIIDINVIKHPGEEDFSKVPDEMLNQINKYHNQLMDYYKQIVAFYESEVNKRRRAGIHSPLLIDDKFHSIIVNAMEYVSKNNRTIFGKGRNVSKKSIKYSYNRTPLDSVRVEIKYAAKVNAVEAFKITNCHGGKTVIVDVWDDDRMPIDSAGNRADIIMDDVSILKRINPSTFYEQYMGAVLTQVKKDVTELMKTDDVDKAWDMLDLLYEIMSPLMHRRVTETIQTITRKREHIQSIIDDGVYIYLPTHSPNMGNKLLTHLKNFKVPYGSVTYKSADGKIIKTKSKCLIGTNYVLLLNKIGDSWSAVTSAKLQHHGIPAKLNSSDRDLTPGRKNPVKFPAEAEIRSMVNVAGTEVAVDICDRSNNPKVNKAICKNILLADNPSDIDDITDRDLHPYGENRAVRQAVHLLECMGIELKYGDKGNVD